MKPFLRLEFQLATAFAFVTLLAASIFTLSFRNTEELKDTSRWVEHTYEVLVELSAVLTAMVDAETGMRGYVLMGRDVFLEPYHAAKGAIHGRIARLGLLTRDNPDQQRRVAELERLVTDHLEYRAEVIRLARSGGLEASRRLMSAGQGKEAMDTIRALIERMRVEEQQLLRLRQAAAEQSSRRTTIALALLLAIGLSVVLGSYLAARWHLKRRALAENRVRALNAELQAANSELDTFNHAVSHELGGPLRAIDGFLSILAESHAASLDAEAAGLLTRVRTAASRMQDLIDDLLRFSRTTRQPLAVEKVDMKVLAEVVVSELGERYPATQVLFGELPQAAGDPSLLRQVWMNLIGNAFKYSAKAPAPRIEILGRMVAAGVEYTVRDNGAGFDPRYVDKLFGVFQRLHSSRDFIGNGVGLAIVKAIIARHGGTVHATGKPNEGAVFSFTLPRH